MRKIENRKKKGKGSNHKYAEAIIYADPRMEHRKDDVNDGGFARERGNLATLILRGIQPFSSFFFFFFFLSCGKRKEESSRLEVKRQPRKVAFKGNFFSLFRLHTPQMHRTVKTSPFTRAAQCVARRFLTRLCKWMREQETSVYGVQR